MEATGESSAGLHTQSSTCIDSYPFLLMISNVITIRTYPFTAGNNHLQKPTKLRPDKCHYTCHQETWHQISLTNYVQKVDRKIIWDHCVKMLLYQASAHILLLHFISLEVHFNVDPQNAILYTIKASHAIQWMIPFARYKLLVFVMTHSMKYLVMKLIFFDLYICDHHRYFLQLDAGESHTTIKGEIWSFVKCGF